MIMIMIDEGVRIRGMAELGVFMCVFSPFHVGVAVYVCVCRFVCADTDARYVICIQIE